jgi:SAM-dependent methyltransferase
MENIKCPLCGIDKTRHLFKKMDYLYKVSSVEYSVVSCKGCGLVYVNPRPTEEEIKDYYTDKFYDVQLDGDELLREKEEQLALKYAFVKDLSPGKLLDIGCAKGEFLYFMQRKGWEVHGIDFSARPPNCFNLDISYDGLRGASFKDGSFDLITLWAVLEHAYEPRETLGHVRRLLRRGGRAVILVPNFHSLPGCFMRQDDIPRHTTFFTKKTLRKMAKKCGFDNVEISFCHRLFGGSNRGVLNFVFKLACGEIIEDIVAQNRSVERWVEFSSRANGKDSRLMRKIDVMDQRLYPHLDPWLDRLGLGYIMIARMA